MPTPSNTRSYHVAGPINLQATVGAGSAYTIVGICEDGIDIELRQFTHDIKFDGAGGPEGDAGEVIFLNATAIIRCVLVPFGGNYVNNLRKLAMANGGVEGVMVSPGTLYGTNGMLPGIQFTSNDVDGGWQFPTCQVVRAGSNKASTKETKPVWEFRAINYIDPSTENSIAGNVLYTRI